LLETFTGFVQAENVAQKSAAATRSPIFILAMFVSPNSVVEQEYTGQEVADMLKRIGCGKHALDYWL
jgi:hypothetical protein